MFSPCFFYQPSLKRDLSDDTDFERQGSTGQQLQTVGIEETSMPNIASSSFSIKLKSKIGSNHFKMFNFLLCL